ncbi:hypothetical protein CR513_44656, partial [Mucuna pruriens]
QSQLDISEKKQQTSIMTNTDSNFVQHAILKLNEHYDHWAMLMENFLRSKEFKGEKLLVSSYDQTVLERILKKVTLKGIWDSMKQKY